MARENAATVAALHASIMTSGPTWRCEHLTGIYEPLPDSNRKRSAERGDAVFVHEGEGYGLVREERCPNYACKDCGTWLLPSETCQAASAQGTNWCNPGTRQWSCPEHTAE